LLAFPFFFRANSSHGLVDRPQQSVKFVKFVVIFTSSRHDLLRLALLCDDLLL